MNELRSLLHSFADARARGLRAALATVIRVEGSSYRRPGAKMLILENGEVSGAVSGGCLERDLIQRAARALVAGQPERVIYDTRLDHEEDEALGDVVPSLGCEGIIEILLDPWPEPWLAALEAALEGRRDAVFVRELAKDGAARPASVLTESERGDVLRRPESFIQGERFFDLLRAPVRLIAFGAGHDAVPLTRLARELGWHTTVVDCRSGFPQPRRFFAHVDELMTASAETAVARAGVDERSVVLVMTHNLAHDGRILRDLLPLAPRYLGLLGPRARGERLLAEVAHERGLSPEKCMSLARFPIGLDLGGDGPAAIALSALAEAQALIHGRTGGFLKDRIGSIHNPNAR